MFVYQKFLIRENDIFKPFDFPQLSLCLQEMLTLLATTPAEPATAMVVSFAKDRCISPQYTAEFPQLTHQIMSGELPLTVLEGLFESSKKNPAFRKELEDYVIAFLTNKKMHSQNE